jgi:hypothetical protein
MSHAPVVAVASTSGAVWNGTTKPFAGSCAAPRCRSGSPVRKVRRQVFALPELLANLTDQRRDPRIPTFDLVNSLFHAAVLRIPSINALEGDLKEGDFQKLIGRQPTQDLKAFSADVVANVLDKMHLDRVRGAMQGASARPSVAKHFATVATVPCAAWLSTAGNHSPPMIGTARTAWCARSK